VRCEIGYVPANGNCVRVGDDGGVVDAGGGGDGGVVVDAGGGEPDGGMCLATTEVCTQNEDCCSGQCLMVIVFKVCL
jgi:hypothetical protein